MMKKLLLTMLSMMFMLAVSAQSDRVVTYLKPYVPEHEIRVGYSPLMPFIFGSSEGRAFFFYLEPFCVGMQGNLVLAGIAFAKTTND